MTETISKLEKLEKVLDDVLPKLSDEDKSKRRYILSQFLSSQAETPIKSLSGKTILISPYARKLRNGKENAKNYPHFPEVVSRLRKMECKTIQVGSKGEKLIGADEYKFDLPIWDLLEWIKSTDTWISVDNFFPHLAAYSETRGVVIFSKSDPNHFGYPDNINLLKGREYLRKDQFGIWEECDFDANAFVKPEEIISAIVSILLP